MPDVADAKVAPVDATAVRFVVPVPDTFVTEPVEVS
jgi:hypothetical protein